MTSTTYNPEKLAEAIKAFGKERLEELREEFPRGRLATYHSDAFLVILKDDEEYEVMAIHENKSFAWYNESWLTYLEPTRPLRKEGHTKEEIYKKVLEETGVGASRVTILNRTLDLAFPTATAPTEEHINTSAIEFPSDDSLLATGQPQPSFTREEMLLLWEAFDSYFTTEVYHDLRAKLRPPISRLDLLIKWWGEQERPSEIEFSVALGYFSTKEPLESSTHYRRGTSEWISLEGVV